jgi:hypothetical protein
MRGELRVVSPSEARSLRQPEDKWWADGAKLLERVVATKMPIAVPIKRLGFAIVSGEQVRLRHGPALVQAPTPAPVRISGLENCPPGLGGSPEYCGARTMCSRPRSGLRALRQIAPIIHDIGQLQISQYTIAEGELDMPKF